MIAVYIHVPYASFRKSYARAYAESYMLPPPSTIYGMLLSLVGERFRNRHSDVQLAFAFGSMPKKAVTLRKLSRLKYGVPSKQSSLGNAPDFVESLCGIELLCWIDSSRENMEQRTLEERVTEAIEQPDKIERYGLLSLGLSDDMVNEVSLWNQGGQFAHAKKWQRLIPKERGSIELPVWVDHLGSSGTRWRRFDLDPEPVHLESQPGGPEWPLLSFSND